jgi:O-antigen biosynthesis protein
MSERRIAIAIATRDRATLLERCLEALRSSELLPVEVAIADQSDGDETRALVERWNADELPLRYLRARPGGLGVAQNDAVAATSAPLVAVLDDDCVADPGWLGAIADAFAADERLGLVAGRVLPLGPETPGTFAVSSRTRETPLDFDGRSLPWHVGSGNNFGVRRTWWERIGGCDERLGPGSPALGGVDMDLFYRFLRAGARARYEPSALVLHERTTKQGRISRRTAYGYGMGACITLWLREGRDRYAWRVLAAWLRMRTLLLARAARHGRWQGVYEELLVLKGTLLGLLHGLRVATRG